MTSVEMRRVAGKLARSLGADLEGQPPDAGVQMEGDEELTDAARGVSGTAEDSADGTGEIDAIGRAAGVDDNDGRPLRGGTVDRRDEHRWELDPRSKSESE